MSTTPPNIQTSTRPNANRRHSCAFAREWQLRRIRKQSQAGCRFAVDRTLHNRGPLKHFGHLMGVSHGRIEAYKATMPQHTIYHYLVVGRFFLASYSTTHLLGRTKKSRVCTSLDMGLDVWIGYRFLHFGVPQAYSTLLYSYIQKSRLYS